RLRKLACGPRSGPSASACWRPARCGSCDRAVIIVITEVLPNGFVLPKCRRVRSRDLTPDLLALSAQRNDAILPRKAVEQAACNWPPYRKKPDLGTNHIAATFRSFILPESISPVTILAR